VRQNDLGANFKHEGVNVKEFEGVLSIEEDRILSHSPFNN